MKMHSTKEAAEQLGVTVRTIQRHCAEHGIGTRVGRDIVLSAKDVAALKGVVVGEVGNPAFKRQKPSSNA